ncbi:hypothetical protein HMPREF0326_05642 [Desulfovibrio sp. 3_1_syn3]|nr:hypothetical protein HMPREF0326_05642 [Desulfovibrio sp. 3_1_syn3]
MIDSQFRYANICVSIGVQERSHRSEGSLGKLLFERY